MGTCPKAIQPGDRLFILMGYDSPVILRPHGTAYKLIGDAYIHGIMEGEALQLLETGKRKLETVELC